MDFLSNRVDRGKIKPGEHVYTYRAGFTYSHHGIYAGGSQVIHFTPERNLNSSTVTSSSFFSSSSNTPSGCPNIDSIPHCGIRQPDSGVVLSCLDCFVGKGSLYCFKYGVSSLLFLSRVRGGTCTTAKSDSSNVVLYRAMYLLLNGFGKYDLFENNCEDFALLCKTGLLIIEDKHAVGRSSQISSVVAPVSAILSFPLKFVISSNVTVAVVTAASYCVCRYASDIGVRTDVIKVAVEDLPFYLETRSNDDSMMLRGPPGDLNS